jgi:thioredoxin-like negative regulator of GroEL
MAPMVHGLEAKYFGRVLFSYIDADDSRTFDIQRALGFRYQPELYLLDAAGTVLLKFLGFTSQEQLESAFAQYLP